MNEIKKTMIFGGVAIVLALVAIVIAPRKITPNAFLDQGQPFFPNFTDPLTATSLEVVSYDEETGSAIPFKVVLKDGKWTIPSHHDYPADGKDRLGKTAASVIDIKKDDFRSDNVNDHELCDVIDPLDETIATVKGRGQRVTLRDKNDEVLADFIIGKKVEGGEGFRFVRVPGQKRIYAVRMNIDISTKFSDWIESDLMQVDRNDIEQVILKDYSINERTGMIDQRGVLVLDKKDDKWTAPGLAANQEIDNTKMSSLLSSLDGLSIVGVRTKPAGLSQSLEETSSGVRITENDMLSLQSKGYYFTHDGRLVSNEGELQARTKAGVTYTLRFGEVAFGTGTELTAGPDSSVSDHQPKGPGENRYLFITTEFDPKKFPAPRKPKDTDFMSKADSLWTSADRENKKLQDAYTEWQGKIEEGEKTSKNLNARFAKWYYVISNSSFEKLHLTRKDLVKLKEEKNKS